MPHIPCFGYSRQTSCYQQSPCRATVYQAIDHAFLSCTWWGHLFSISNLRPDTQLTRHVLSHPTISTSSLYNCAVAVLSQYWLGNWSCNYNAGTHSMCCMFWVMITYKWQIILQPWFLIILVCRGLYCACLPQSQGFSAGTCGERKPRDIWLTRLGNGC